MTEVIITLTKSQKEAQEMSGYVMELAEEIKQLRVSRAREETVRAKVASVGDAQKKLARAEIKPLQERIKYQGENMSERRDSVGTTVERPLQRHSQGGGLYEDAKRFLDGAFDFRGLGHCTCDEHPREEKLPTWMEMPVTVIRWRRSTSSK